MASPPRPSPVVQAATQQRPATQGPSTAPTPAPDWALANGRFFTQANGQPLGVSTRGFVISDAGGVKFWSEYQDLGGPRALGYPTSHRFLWRYQTVQLLQDGLLQWWPDDHRSTVVNLMDELHLAGLDDRLLSERFVPRQMPYNAEAGLTFEQVKARRLALLDADPDLRAQYFAVPNPIEKYGLPTSRVTDLGPVIAVRLQRGVLQHWKQDMAWASAGDVTSVMVGDLARDFGLFGAPTTPFVPVEPIAAMQTARIAAVRAEDY